MFPCGYIDKPHPKPKPSPFQGAYPISGCDSLVEWLDKLSGSDTFPYS